MKALLCKYVRAFGSGAQISLDCLCVSVCVCLYV